MTPEKELRAGRSRKKECCCGSRLRYQKEAADIPFSWIYVNPPPKREIGFGHFVLFFRDRCNLTPDWSLFSPFFPPSVTQSICLDSRGMRIHQIKGKATGWISATTNIRRISNSQNHPSFLSQKNHRRKKRLRSCLQKDLWILFLLPPPFSLGWPEGHRIEKEEESTMMLLQTWATSFSTAALFLA